MQVFAQIDPYPSMPTTGTRTRRLFAGVSVVVALAGIVSAVLMPHGPATGMQAISLLATCLGIGLLAGWALASAWAIVPVVVIYLVCVELTRLGTPGATTGAIRLDNAYGILAFLSGRGFHGLVSLAPMAVGVWLGSKIAKARAQQQHAPSQGRVRATLSWLGLGLSLLVLLLLALLLVLPASTPPILGVDGRPLPGSIAEVVKVPIGGQEQGLMLRGHSVDKPVLLYLSGGPGQSSLPYPRVILSDLEQDFIVVGWDQRGTGKSYAALDPVRDLTLDRAISDTIEVADYLRTRFDENKVYLLGESWGTTLAVLAAQRQPDRFYAIISSGQMVSQRETDRRLYQDVLSLANARGDGGLARQMKAYGKPPYGDIPYAYGFVMGFYEDLYMPYTPPEAFIERGAHAGIGPFGVLGSEYDFVEKVNVVRGLLDMFTVMYPQLQEIDFRADVKELVVPLYLLDGRAELASRRDLAIEWYGQLNAPHKRIFSFENAAHAVAFEQFEALHQILTDVVLPETYGGR